MELLIYDACCMKKKQAVVDNFLSYQYHLVTQLSPAYHRIWIYQFISRALKRTVTHDHTDWYHNFRSPLTENLI